MGGRANFGDAFAGFSTHFGLINDNQLTARVAFMLDFESQTTQTGDKLPGYPDRVNATELKAHGVSTYANQRTITFPRDVPIQLILVDSGREDSPDDLEIRADLKPLQSATAVPLNPFPNVTQIGWILGLPPTAADDGHIPIDPAQSLHQLPYTTPPFKLSFTHVDGSFAITDGVSPPIQSGGVAIDISDEMMDWAPPGHRSPTIVSLLRPDHSSPSD